MLPALTTKPKQSMRQVKGLSNDSIDSYSNTPLGGGAGLGGGMTSSYVDNTEVGNGTARGSPRTSGRATVNTGRTTVAKTSEEGLMLARVVRDRQASGEEELTLRIGDVVKVLSSKRTGYLKCEAGDEVGYVPSSYLEFLDGGVETENGSVNDATEETQRAEKLRKKQHRKEKRKKEKREVHDASDPEEGASVTARSPRKQVPVAEGEGVESPRKSKKKSRKHRQDREGEDGARSRISSVDEAPTTARSRVASEDTERARSKSKNSKKKRHRDLDTSDSSESDGAKRTGRRSHRRRHRRGSSASDSESTTSGDSDASYRRRRRRRRHRHKRSSSEEDEDDSDYKRRSRRAKKRRDKGDEDSELEDGSRSVRKAEKKKLALAVHEAEKGVSQLSMKSEEKASESVETKAASKKEDFDRERGKREETERSEGSSEGRATSVSTDRKYDEGRGSTSTSSSSQKQNGNKSGLGRQIGDKMRSFLGGSKKQQSTKSSSGILNACPGTIQGEEGWYEHGENERYYFVLVDGKWSLLYGPMTEDDFEAFSSRVLEQNRSIELPKTYLHKTGYSLTRELRVQKD